jgi:hypothetical protein
MKVLRQTSQMRSTEALRGFVALTLRRFASSLQM